MPEQQIGLIAKLFGIITASAAGLFGVGKYHGTLVKKPELYKSDGSLIYLTVEQSKQNITDCRNTMNKELETTHKKLDRITEYLKEQNSRQLEMSEFIGTVKQFMQNNK